MPGGDDEPVLIIRMGDIRQNLLQVPWRELAGSTGGPDLIDKGHI